jgi:hypothetical protein
LAIAALAAIAASCTMECAVSAKRALAGHANFLAKIFCSIIRKRAGYEPESVKGRKFGKVRAVKTLKTTWTRPGTAYQTDHEMDLTASLPIAAAFRELLELKLKGDRYYWRADYKKVFAHANEELYKALLNKVRIAKAVNALGADTEYWTLGIEHRASR